MTYDEFTLSEVSNVDPSGIQAYIPKDKFETAMQKLGLSKERSNMRLTSSSVRFVGTYVNCYVQLHCHIMYAPDPNDPDGPGSKLVVCTDPTSNTLFNFYHLKANLLEAVTLTGSGSRTYKSDVCKLIHDMLEPDDDDGYYYSTQKNFD